MRIIGGFICFLAFFSLSVQITFISVVWLLFGIFLVAIPEILEMFMRTERFIHRSNRDVKK
jgi:diacylglycerol kinase